MLARNLFAYGIRENSSPVQLVGYDIEKPDILHGFENVKFAADEVYAEFPKIDSIKCKYCGACVNFCSFGALLLDRMRPSITVNPERCVACSECIDGCSIHGISKRERLTGYVLQGRLSGHLITIGKRDESHDFLVPLVCSLNNRLKPGYVAICDLGPGTSGYVYTALSSTTRAIVLLKPSLGWLRNIQYMLDMVNGKSIFIGIVVNKYRGEESFLEEVNQFCRKAASPLLGVIPFSSELSDEKTCSFSATNPEMEAIFAAIWKGAVS